MVAPVVLPLGTRVISLVVSDQTASCTNSVSVSVLTPLQAIERIIGMLNKTGTVHPTSLTASLKAARASVDGGNPAAAVSQLGVFQNKVRSQVVPSNPGLAKTCLPLAQQVMDALQGGEAGELEVKVLSVKQETGGAARLSFKGAAGRVHIVEASTNLVDWEVIGAAVERAAGSYEFEDANASNLPGRFYRAKQLAR